METDGCESGLFRIQISHIDLTYIVFCGGNTEFKLLLKKKQKNQFHIITTNY